MILYLRSSVCMYHCSFTPIHTHTHHMHTHTHMHTDTHAYMNVHAYIYMHTDKSREGISEMSEWEGLKGEKEKEL